MKNNY